MTFDASRLIVFAMTAPHPSRKALAMTFKFVPGGPEPMMNGFGSLRPSTVVARVGMAADYGTAKAAKRGNYGKEIPSAKIQIPGKLQGTSLQNQMALATALVRWN